MRNPLRYRAALVAALISSPACAADVVADFDAAVAGQLPASLAWPASEGEPAHVLVVDRRMDVVVDMPGVAPASMFHGQLDGRPVAVTRAGHTVSVSARGPGGVDILIAGQGDAPRSVHVDVPADSGPAPSSRRRRAASADRDSPFTHVVRPGDDDLALSNTGNVQPLRFFVFLHDELVRPGAVQPDPLQLIYGRGPAPVPSIQEAIEDIHAGYVAWWLAELDREILPREPIRVIYRARMPGITDARYGTESSLIDWAHDLPLGNPRHGLPWPLSYRDKFILLVAHEVAPGTGGKAFVEGHAAIASLGAQYSVVAHELGHTLGATHDDAEVRFQGLWWCQSTMVAQPSAFLSHCYEYSAANRARIHDYYSGGPGRPRAQGLAMREADD